MEDNTFYVKEFDPTILAELAKEQYPDKPWLADGIKKCIKVWYKSDVYYYCYDPAKPKPWTRTNSKCSGGFQLDGDESIGEVIIDVVEEQIAGFEFMLELTGKWNYLRRCGKNTITV